MGALSLGLILGLAGVVSASTYDHLVNVDVDGVVVPVRTQSDTVDQLLADEGIVLRADDVVSPALSTDLDNGDVVQVRSAKPVTLVVDGKISQKTVHSATVSEALQTLGVRPHRGAALSMSPDDRLSANGNSLIVSNPKELTVRADGKTRSLTTTAATVSDVLDELHVRVDGDDEIKPGLGSYVKPDQALRVVRIETVTRTETLAVDFSVKVKDDSAMYRGETEVVTTGQAGRDRAKVELVLADGKVRERRVISRSSIREPIAQVVKRGTKNPDSVDGGVWDKIAQCESGGNWSINTGNGYYGGLQFSLPTWRSVGGSGLPSENSKAEQIKRAKILQARSGWGQWSCAAKVGLG